LSCLPAVEGPGNNGRIYHRAARGYERRGTGEGRRPARALAVGALMSSAGRACQSRKLKRLTLRAARWLAEM
jgi:hypothetical protein